MKAPEIKGVLFDIGGVLVELDGGPSLAAMLGVAPDHESLHGLWIASPSVAAHETGRIAEDEFAAGLVAELGLPISAEAFLQEFCDWPKGLLPGALELLEEMPAGCRVAALRCRALASHPADGPCRAIPANLPVA